MTDYGKRPYASNASNYSDFMDEETEQLYRSRKYEINPDLKQPYTFNDYTEMMYLYSGTYRKKEDNIDPVIIATITSPDIELFDFFVEETTNILVDEDFNALSAWTEYDSGTEGIVYEIDPASEFHGYVMYDGGRFADSVALYTTYTSTAIPVSYTIEFEIQLDTIGSDANSKINFYVNGVDPPLWDFNLIFKIGGIFVSDGSDYVQIGTVVPTSNGTASYQKWRVVCTSTGESTSTCELFLEVDGSYVSQGSVNCSYALASPLSAFMFQYYAQDAVTATEIHMRNIKLYYV